MNLAKFKETVIIIAFVCKQKKRSRIFELPRHCIRLSVVSFFHKTQYPDGNWNWDILIIYFKFEIAFNKLVTGKQFQRVVLFERSSFSFFV